MPEGAAYRRNSVVMHMRVLKELQDWVPRRIEEQLTCRGIRGTSEKEPCLSCRRGLRENPESLVILSKPRWQTLPSLSH